MGGHGYRNMYYLTGQPGWMRFGYSPGWGGVPPCAQYLSQTDQLPRFTSWMQQQAPTGVPTATAGVTKEQEIQALEAQLDGIKKRLGELKK